MYSTVSCAELYFVFILLAFAFVASMFCESLACLKFVGSCILLLSHNKVDDLFMCMFECMFEYCCFFVSNLSAFVIVTSIFCVTCLSWIRLFMYDTVESQVKWALHICCTQL